MEEAKAGGLGRGVWFQILLELKGNLCVSRTAPPLPAYVSDPTYPLPRGRKEGVAVISGSSTRFLFCLHVQICPEAWGIQKSTQRVAQLCSLKTERGKTGLS